MVFQQSQKRTSVRQLRWDFSPTRIHAGTCTELCEAFTFLVENIYVQFYGIVYQQIVGILMGTNCAPLIGDLFLYYYERDFLSNFQKSIQFDLVDKFDDTSRYLDDIFTIDNPEFA